MLNCTEFCRAIFAGTPLQTPLQCHIKVWGGACGIADGGHCYEPFRPHTLHSHFLHSVLWSSVSVGICQSCPVSLWTGRRGSARVRRVSGLEPSGLTLQIMHLIANDFSLKSASASRKAVYDRKRQYGCRNLPHRRNKYSRNNNSLSLQKVTVPH